MTEREELRERLWVVLNDILDDAARDPGFDSLTPYLDRILSDPQIERALRIAEQEPVAWRVETKFGDSGWMGYDLRSSKDLAEKMASVATNRRVVPLVPLTTNSEAVPHE